MFYALMCVYVFRALISGSHAEPGDIFITIRDGADRQNARNNNHETAHVSRDRTESTRTTRTPSEWDEEESAGAFMCHVCIFACVCVYEYLIEQKS